jgi:phospho-N-acetylmuramoyl-pentapeptide-transferase
MTGKRVFKMSPLHHHFEMSGWSEWKVDTVFWAIGLIASIVVLLIVL